MFGLAIIFGFLAAAAALLVQVLLSLFVSAPLTGVPSLALLIGAATIEEGAKLAFLFQFGRRTSMPIPFLSALLFSLGFVGAEMTLLTLSNSALPAFSLLGAIVLVHIIGTIIIYASLRFREDFAFSPLFGLLTAILIHTLYNSSL